MTLIVLGVSGSIAAMRAFDLCRELRKNGFEVQIVMSDSAKEIVTQNSLEFASGRKVITTLSGKIEHVKYFGKKGRAALLLIAPATANTISKIAQGIDDTTITTFASVAIGSKRPVLLAPAMHAPMYEHPIVLENLQKLEKRGVRIIDPLMNEGKAKLAEIEKIIFEVQKSLAKNLLERKKVLVASGAFEEQIDDFRVLTNKSSGRFGCEIALCAMIEGAQVKVIGNGAKKSFFDFEEVINANELEQKVTKELSKGYDYFFSPAAIPDFSVDKRSGKIDSAKEMQLKLKPREKMLTAIAKKFPKLRIIAFKAVWAKSKKEIEKVAIDFIKKNNFHAAVANDVSKNGFGSENGEFFICTAKTKKWISASKEIAAKEIVSII